MRWLLNVDRRWFKLDNIYCDVKFYRGKMFAVFFFWKLLITIGLFTIAPFSTPYLCMGFVSFKMLRRSRVGKKKVSAESAFGESTREELWSTSDSLKSFQQRHSFNFTATKSFAGEKPVCCAIKVERAEEVLCYVTSLQGAIAFL